MSPETELTLKREIPTRAGSMLFRVKTALLQARRMMSDVFDGDVKRSHRTEMLSGTSVIGRSESPLWTETDEREKHLVAGKIQNLRVAVRSVDGITFAPGETFSFWQQVGRATRWKGYVKGRELREGCIVPAIGGGLCQLSNALYDAALQAGLEIVERHAHSRVVPGSLAEMGRDATVFWNYVDLRFRSDRVFSIEAKISTDRLLVNIRGEQPMSPQLYQIGRAASLAPTGSCATCGEDNCHKVVIRPEKKAQVRSAFLLDEFSPEFDAYIKDTANDGDEIFIPIDGNRFGKANYAWTGGTATRIRQRPLLTAKRSLASRRLATQGAARQRSLLNTNRELALSYARSLTFETLHLTIHQGLLPYLWREGYLGGRSFDVLMNALPMSEIQKRLDHAAELHPESTTLGDFRADEKLVEAEDEALRHARKVITSHSEIASVFADKCEILDWAMSVPEEVERIRSRPTIVFPSSTVGRKGCYELREALRGSDVRLLTLGPYIEGSDFWQGLDVERGGDDWLSVADAVVLPAFVEHKPRRLLRAVASGIPAVVTPACGISYASGVQIVQAGDAAALRNAICAIFD